MENNVLKTGYRKLDDRHYGGIKRGELTMVYARPGMGKTTFLSSIFLNMISQIPQTKCLFFSFDEPEEYVFEKMVCIKGGVAPWMYYDRGCTEKEKMKIAKVEEWLKGKLQVKNQKSRIIERVSSFSELLLCVAEKMTDGLDVVFIDGLSYLREYTYEDIHHVVYILNELAVRLNIAVLITELLPNDKPYRPIVRQIKDKYIWRTVDKIIVLNRPEAFATAEELESGHIVKGAVELNIIKNHTGYCGFVSLRFDSSTMRFYEPENDYCEDVEQ